jgi:hypothetical protein
MTRRQAASVVQMGLVAGVLGFVSFGVGQPGGAGLLALAVLSAITGWGISGGARWGRYLGVLAAIVSGGAGAYGIYALVAVIAYTLTSRFNLAVLAVLLLLGITCIVLLALLVGVKASTEDPTAHSPRRRATLIASGLVIGIGASGVFSSWLSTWTEPPCCPL